jgi:DNA-binding winged helix-turn-helix (wHTH) protein/TolB-like protein/tetratricopeptide (TPR) repeat protein
MYESTQDAMWVHGIDLAREADFELGSLRVRPARCAVEANGNSRTLQRRVMQVLVALAQARGSVVSQDDLVIRCWRGLSVSDDAIYRCISKLRKLAAGYSDAPFAIEAIPGVGYRLTSADAAEGASARQSAKPSRRRIGAFIAAAALAALVLVGAVIWNARSGAPDGSQPVRVTVQPFGALSNSEDARSLARRIPNEIVNELGDSQIETVLGEEDASARATRSNSGLIVTGLLRDDAPNVIAAVRIEDGATRAALWSMEFKRDRRQASDLPMEVAARVADIVNMAIFARSASPPLSDPSGLSALLQTSDMIRDSDGGAWAQMIESAQRLVARHPDFAFGHSVLAAAYAEAAHSIDVPDRVEGMRDAARREANLTLKLDPEDAGAYAVLAGLERPYNYRAEEEILRRGMKFAKHPKEPLGALYSYEGTLLSNVGRLREALSYQLIARATDEWGAPKTAKVALTYANMGDFPAARAWMRKAVQRWPNHSGVRSVRRYIAGFYEPPEDALEIITSMEAQASREERQAATWQAFTEARAAHAKKPAAIREIREAADQGRITRENGIMMLAGLGEPKLAIDAANSALDHRQSLQAWFLFTAVTRNLRQDPGFVPLAARLGLIEYWRETGKRPDFCTDPATSNECSPQLLAALKAN